MTKRSRRNQGIDIVSETQQNARWLYGYRSKTSVSDKTPAEWARLTRQLFAQNRPEWIITFISMVFIGLSLLGGAIGAAKTSGFLLASVGLVLLSILILGVAALYLRKFLSTPTQRSNRKIHRKKES